MMLLSTITYGEIIDKFKAHRPDVMVEDYRPADYIPCAILVWTWDNLYLVIYQPTFDAIFIIAREKKHEKKSYLDGPRIGLLDPDDGLQRGDEG